MKYELAQASRLGNRRRNEDRLGAIETPEGVLLVVADGMGGHLAGDVAAEALVATASAAYEGSARPIEDPRGFFKELIWKAHGTILELEEKQQLSATPGTTAVFALIQNAQVWAAHVGDSRFYVFRDGLPLYRTRDHSYVEQLRRHGRISRSEVDSHPRRNQVTRCVGAQAEPPKIEVGKPIALRPDDVLVLCTDGLWGALDDARMGAVVASGGPIGETVEALAEVAERSAWPNSDNVSVVALRVTEADTGHPAARVSEQKGRDQLQDAIEEIERVFSEYKDELPGR